MWFELHPLRSTSTTGLIPASKFSAKPRESDAMKESMVKLRHQILHAIDCQYLHRCAAFLCSLQRSSEWGRESLKVSRRKYKDIRPKRVQMSLVSWFPCVSLQILFTYYLMLKSERLLGSLLPSGPRQDGDSFFQLHIRKIWSLSCFVCCGCEVWRSRLDCGNGRRRA